MANKIQIRRDTAANWTSTNPTLSQGEQGYEIDTSKFKIGDGTTAWTSLSYFSGYTDADVDTHLNTSTATNGEYLSWDGSDYDWATVPTGYTNSDVDTHLNTSTATSGEVLSWTGTDYDWITAGGGGADLYAANESSPTAQPSATGTNSIAIGDSAVSTGTNSFAGPKSNAGGEKSFAVSVGNNTTTYGAQATGSVAIGTSARAMALDSQAFGSQSRTTGNWSTAIGYGAFASVTDSVAVGGTGKQVKISGVYTLPTADGTNGQVMTTNGSGVVTFADAGGGGGALELYAENPSTPTTPTATGTNDVAIGSGAIASGGESIALGDGAIASGSESVALGIARSPNSGSIAIGIATNSSSYGPFGNGATAIGQLNKASASGAFALGRTSFANAEGTFTYGKDNTASKAFAVAGGSYALSNTIGKQAFASGRFAYDVGSAQTGTFVLRSDTTDATSEALTANNSNAGTTNQIVLPNNSAIAFHGTIVARQQASSGTASAAWKIEGLIRREGSASTTVLVSSTTTVLDNTPSWGMTLSADTTNGALKIEVTGASATNIRWVATVSTSEVTY